MADLLATALAYHQRGLLEEAARIYEMLIAGDPAHADALHLLGLVAIQQGRPSLGDELIGRATAVAPGVAMYHANRAEALRMLGRLEQAVGEFEAALALRPRFPAALNNLGLCLQALGRSEGAMRRFQEALQIQPGFAMAHNNLAMALYSHGQTDDAMGHFRCCLELDPTLAEAHSNLGQLLRERGRLEDALLHGREAVWLQPGFPQGQLNLGRVLRALGRPAEARVCFAEALRLEPDWAVACHDLGEVVHEEGKLEESLGWFDRSLSLDPGFGLAHCSRGVVLGELGDLEGAERAFRAALASGSCQAEAYYQPATLAQGGLSAGDLAAMRALSAEPGLSDDERSTIHSGVALVLDSLGECEAAAEHLRQANAFGLADARAHGQRYDCATHSSLVAGLIATCTTAFFERVRGYGVESDRPIFVVGLPRTGTTLNEQILASHPDVFGAGELTLARDGFESIAGLLKCTDPAPDCLGRLDRATAADLASRHLDQLAVLNAGARRVVDKMPENYLYLGMLAVLFPRARFVHCRRDPRDVAVSCWMTHFRHVGWTNDTMDIVSRIVDHERLMEHWSRVLPVRWLDVPYEETVADFESVARRLVAWCGLDWDPACLAFHQGRRTVRSASFAQVRRPLNSRSVGRWKNYERALAPLLALLQSNRVLH